MDKSKILDEQMKRAVIADYISYCCDTQVGCFSEERLFQMTEFQIKRVTDTILSDGVLDILHICEAYILINFAESIGLDFSNYQNNSRSLNINKNTIIKMAESNLNPKQIKISKGIVANFLKIHSEGRNYGGVSFALGCG